MTGIEAIEHEQAKVRMLRDDAAKHEKWDRAYGWSCVLEGIDRAARILLGGGGAERQGEKPSATEARHTDESSD